MQVDYIDLNWTFKDVVNNIEVIRTKTRGIIASFSSFEAKKQLQFKRSLRNTIYSLKIQMWQKERMWEVLNDDFDIKNFKKLI